jgi:hypothetical protein
MEQKTKRTDGVGQGSGLVPGVLGEVGAGAIPGVLPVQRGGGWVRETNRLADYILSMPPTSVHDFVAHAKKLAKGLDETEREWMHAVAIGERLTKQRDELRAEVERLREAGENLREHLVSTPPGAPLDVPDDIWLPFTKALAGKEGAPSQRLDLGDKLIHERDIARQWATELANALDGLGYPDRIQMEAFRQVEQGWKEGA